MTDEQIAKLYDQALIIENNGDYVAGELDPVKFAKLVAEHEREEIAQIFDVDPHLVDLARNDKGGCLICGFTPKVAAQLIRARGEA